MDVLVLSVAILTYPVQVHYPRLTSAVMCLTFVYSLTLNDVYFSVPVCNDLPSPFHRCFRGGVIPCVLLGW